MVEQTLVHKNFKNRTEYFKNNYCHTLTTKRPQKLMETVLGWIRVKFVAEAGLHPSTKFPKNPLVIEKLENLMIIKIKHIKVCGLVLKQC